MKQPLGVTYSLTPAWAQSLRSLAQALNAQLVLGVNLEADSPRLAQTEADEFLQLIGPRYVSALDIGNEPPLYSSVPWYRREGQDVIPWYSDEGTPVFSRDLHWGPANFVAEYARILDALPQIPIAGPDTQRADWFAAYERFLSPRSRVRMLASHGYGLNNCVTNPASAAYPSIRTCSRLRAARSPQHADPLRRRRPPQRRHVPRRRDGLGHLQRSPRGGRHDGLGPVGRGRAVQRRP